ncbi:uncharacterized protein EV420DRAFT_1582957 [Desarmillaria tabescens]|uniref:Uncharacterized protein n=1 Tax=Armillaria tabescens TaxID=1929756 RepID=A0AA39MN22_ARMTA|nr:uncharacterized protein EV420DRAFT_1582957 [Desarmillaria tabescens]KAK0439938.1 hypothetical protein EV420DRAFT_1582957 [Desarmillaria tabescens]
MFQPGGYADDNETDELEKMNVDTVEEKKLGKQARGGDKRWKASHLPEGAQIKFADVFTRRLREFTGTLEPWANPTIAEIQGLVDEVYGTKKFEVKQNDVWMGLSGYHISDWRHDFTKASLESFRRFTTDNPDYFVNEEDIAYYTQWATTHLDDTAPFHWKSWGSGVKKSGRFRNILILRTLAEAHYVSLDAIGDIEAVPKPAGALLLAIQAVERTLGMYQTGSLVIDTSSSGHFSVENWGDKWERSMSGKPRRIRRATRFLQMVKDFDNTTWKKILDPVKKLVDDSASKRKRRTEMTTATTSSVGESIDFEDDGQAVLESDVEEDADSQDGGLCHDANQTDTSSTVYRDSTPIGIDSGTTTECNTDEGECDNANDSAMDVEHDSVVATRSSSPELRHSSPV